MGSGGSGHKIAQLPLLLAQKPVEFYCAVIGTKELGCCIERASYNFTFCPRCFHSYF